MLLIKSAVFLARRPRSLPSPLAWGADIEDDLSHEWEIGGLSMTTDAIRALSQANKNYWRKHEHHHNCTGNRSSESPTKRNLDGRRLRPLLALYGAGSAHFLRTTRCTCGKPAARCGLRLGPGCAVGGA